MKAQETRCLAPCVAIPLQASLPCAGFPYDAFNIEDAMLPADDDMGIPSEDDEEVEQDVQTETGFGCVIGGGTLGRRWLCRWLAVRQGSRQGLAAAGVGQQQGLLAGAGKLSRPCLTLIATWGWVHKGLTIGCKAAWAILPGGVLTPASGVADWSTFAMV